MRIIIHHSQKFHLWSLPSPNTFHISKGPSLIFLQSLEIFQIFLELYLNGFTQDALFFVYHFLLRIILLRYIYIVAWINKPFLFIFRWYSIALALACPFLLILLIDIIDPIDRYVDCSKFLATANEIIMNGWVHCTDIWFHISWLNLQVKWQGLMERICFTF